MPHFRPHNNAGEKRSQDFTSSARPLDLRHYLRNQAVKNQDKELNWETAPDSLTVEEAATLLRIPRNAAYEAVRLGLLPAVNFGKRRTRISKAALRKVLGAASEESTSTAAFNHLPGGVK
jgi:excisionase family DNA binding protein